MVASPSFWETDTLLRKADLLIIGSGIVGLSAALAAKANDPHLRIVVIERGCLPTGASTRNAGFACFGSMTELLDDLTTQSEEEVFALVARRYAGLRRLRERVGDTALHYENYGGTELFSESDALIFAECTDRMTHFNQQLHRIVGIKNVYAVANEKLAVCGFRQIKNLIHNCAEGQIDTGKMMAALLRQAYANDIQVLNGLTIKTITEHADEITLHSDDGIDLRAAQVLVCTNGFTRRLLPHLAVVPARNQVLITAPIADLPWRGCFHYEAGYFYFRNVGNRILLGGGRNKDPETEQTDEFGSNDLIQKTLLNLLHTVILPQQTPVIEQWWSGILGVGAIKKPIIERLSPRLTVAVRMGGMGVAIGSLVGEEGAALALS